MITLYNNILLHSRKNIIFSNFIDENLENKIFSFLIHLSSIFNNYSNIKEKKLQIFFDYVFKRIETDLREVGFGDMSVNKKMKIIVSKFYSILVDFKKFNHLDLKEKKSILSKYFKDIKNIESFCEYLVFFFEKGYKDVDLRYLNDNNPA